MKRVLFFFFIVISGLILTSCEDSAVSSGRKTYEHYFEKNLKDPNSLIIYSEKHKIDPSDSDYILWTIDYGAKNSYGGMVRKTVYFKTYKKGRPFLMKDSKNGSWILEP